MTAGVGLFIAFIGLKNDGIIVPDPATTVTLGNLHDPNTMLAIFGLLLIAALLAWGVRAAMLFGILTKTLDGAALGLVSWHPQSYKLSEISAAAFKLDIAATLKIGLLEIVFVFLFVDLFNNIGTFVGRAEEQASLHRHRLLFLAALFIAPIVGAIPGRPPRLRRSSSEASWLQPSAKSIGPISQSPSRPF